MKTSELTGALLDYWVARAERKSVYADPNSPHGTLFYDDAESTTGRFIWMPSRGWAQGGPLIEKYRLALAPMEGWAAYHGDDGVMGQYWIDASAWDGTRGDTPLQAICRAVVRAAFGDEVGEAA